MRRLLIFGAVDVLLLVVVGLAVPFGATLGRRLTDEFGGRVEREAFAVAAASEDQIEQGRTAGLQPLVERLAAQIGGRVLLTDASGVLLADSLQAPGDAPVSYASRPEVARALAGSPVWEVRSSRTLGYDLLVSAVPVASTGRVLGVARLSYPMGEVRAAIHRAWWFLAAVGAVTLAIGLALAVWLSLWATRPLKRAAAVARRIAAGDLEARVPESGPPEVRELAADLNGMTARLADQVRASREFAANASHQLRTPLAALRLSLEEARDGPDPAGEIGHALEATDRLADVVHDLLSLGEVRERGSEAVDLRAVATAAVAALPPGGPLVALEGEGVGLAEHGRVLQVFTNLLENARRHARSQVLVAVAGEGDRVRVSVEDDGPGVPEEDRARVFDRFYRGREVRGSGSGLGLAVARELAAADGATIELTSSSLGGARFEVVFRAPRSPNDPFMTGPPAPTSAPSSRTH